MLTVQRLGSLVIADGILGMVAEKMAADLGCSPVVHCPHRIGSADSTIIEFDSEDEADSLFQLLDEAVD